MPGVGFGVQGLGCWVLHKFRDSGLGGLGSSAQGPESPVEETLGFGFMV